MSRLTLAAWGNKRIADMSRDELIAALNEASASYMAIARSTLNPSELKPITFEVKEAEKIFDSIQTPLPEST